VFGEDVEFDPETGEPIEKGSGSAAQPTPHPTSPKSLSPTPAQLTLLHRIVAGMANAELMRDFKRFLAFREKHPENEILDMPLTLIVNDPSHVMPLDETKVNLYRSMLRVGKFPSPVALHDKNADGVYQLIEGHYRTESARREQHKTIRAEVIKEKEIIR
jgi:hypothetical protein